MQQLKCINKHTLKCPESRIHAFCIIGIVEPGLNHLDIPITEFIPDEVIYLLYCNTKLKFVHVLSNIFDYGIELTYYPLIYRLKILIIRLGDGSAFHIHHDETARIPYLVGEVSACLNP